MIKQCNYCKSKKLFVEVKKDRIGLYCGECGKWQKWISKQEFQIAKFNDIKIIKDIYNK